MILIIAIVLVLIGSFVFWGIKQNDGNKSYSDGSIIYYYGENCSHCKKVQEFISANNIEDRLTIVKKEVINPANSKNAKEWFEKAKECGLKQDGLGVPFIYAKGNCYMGDVDAIEFLRKESSIQ